MRQDQGHWVPCVLGFHFPLLLDATFDSFQSVTTSKRPPMVSKVSPEPIRCHTRGLRLSSEKWEIGFFSSNIYGTVYYFSLLYNGPQFFDIFYLFN